VSGELVFVGTRVPAKNLVDYLKAGDNLDIFLDDFPSVTREQVVAYLEMSAELRPANEMHVLLNENLPLLRLRP